MNRILVLGLVLVQASIAQAQADRSSWAKRLGWPADKRVLLLHADDIGMCHEANASAQRSLARGEYRSAAAMVPCPWFDEMASWCVEHPSHDVGLHLTLTSEWKYYRWGPIAPRDRVRGLLDPFGYLHGNVAGVLQSATGDEVATEIKAQLARARKLGMKPSHIDTHMGTLYKKTEYMRAYLDLAVTEEIPAMVIDMTPRNLEKFRGQGYPIRGELLKLIENYPLPKLDDFHGIQSAKTYQEKRTQLFDLVRGLPPGLHEIIFHPSMETEGLKRITGSWQQRSWEDRLFADPAVIQFWKDEGVILTDWKEVLARHKRK